MDNSNFTPLHGSGANVVIMCLNRHAQATGSMSLMQQCGGVFSGECSAALGCGCMGDAGWPQAVRGSRTWKCGFMNPHLHSPLHPGQVARRKFQDSTVQIDANSHPPLPRHPPATPSHGIGETTSLYSDIALPFRATARAPAEGSGERYGVSSGRDHPIKGAKHANMWPGSAGERCGCGAREVVDGNSRAAADT